MLSLEGFIASVFCLLLFAGSVVRAVDLPKQVDVTQQVPNTCAAYVPVQDFQTPPATYQPKYHTLAHRLLDAEQAVSQVNLGMYANLDTLLDEAKASLKPLPADLNSEEARQFAVAALHTMDCILLRHGFVYPGRGAVQLLRDGLEPTFYKNFSHLNEVYRKSHNVRRRFFVNARAYGPFYVVDCDLAAFLFFAMAEVMGYPLKLAEVPNHIFVRWHFSANEFINYETMDGVVVDDRYYQQEWEIPQPLVHQGGVLQSMSEHEALAYHTAAVAEAWSWQQQYEPMLQGYLQALAQDGTRPFAAHNLAWYFMAVPTADTQQGAQAIKYAQWAVTVFPSADNLDTLACAYAFAQDFTQALKTISLAERQGYSPFAANLSGHRQRFNQKQTCAADEFGRDLTPFRPQTSGQQNFP